MCMLVAALLKAVVVVVFGSKRAMGVLLGPKCVEVQPKGVGVKEAPWKMGQPVAGGTGCRGLLVTGG